MTAETWEALGKELHLDKPLVVQYFLWLSDVLRGDLGYGLLDRQPVAKSLAEKYPNTIRLGLAAFILATTIGIPLGVVAAVKRGTIWDYMARGLALLGQALPVFWIGIMGILVFSVYLRWLPSGTMGEGMAIRNYILPAVVLGILPMAGYCRLVRSSMLEVLDSEYIKFARSKGVREWVVIWKHAFKNALIAPLTFSAIQLAAFVSGAIVAETVFSWPGVGRLSVEAVWQDDFPIITGTVLTISATYVLMNLIADVGYAFIDPRIRYD